MQDKKFPVKKYLKEKGNKIPIYKCLISDLYGDNNGLTTCLIIRKQPSGNFSFACFLVDRYCLGVKSTIVNCNMSQIEIDELIQRMFQNSIPEEVSPEYFHNMIYGAIDYAEDLGLPPSKEFYLAEYLLDPALVDDGIDDIEFGKDGKPLYISGPLDNSQRITAILTKNLGSDGFEYICMV